MKNTEYYTTNEAQRVLGMTHEALRKQADAGNIRTIIPSGKREVFYNKEDVDQLKSEIDARLIGRHLTGPMHVKFVRATIEDMPEAVALADAVFGGYNTISVKKRVDWLQSNPDIDYLLKLDDQIVGYLSIAPLRPETIDDLLKQRRFAKDLEADDILPYFPNTPLDIYGMGIGVRPQLTIQQKREWGRALLLGAREVIVSLGQRGILLRSFKAHSSTVDGIRMMRHIGFTEVVATIPGMYDFTLDIESSDFSFFLEYKKALNKWQERHVSI